LFWDARSGRDPQAVVVRPGGIGALCFSPDGRRLAAGLFHARRAAVFDWDGQRLSQVQTPEAHRTSCWAVAYSPDGKYLASGDHQRFVLYHAGTLEPIRTVETPSEHLAFTPDSRVLFAASPTEAERRVHTFTRWAVEQREELGVLSLELSATPEHAF